MNPHNLLLTSTGRLKVADFRLAKCLMHNHHGDLHHIGTEIIDSINSKQYASPEITEGRAHDFETDIWSLGSILYELCTLQDPAMIDKQGKQDLNNLLPSFSAGLNNLLSELLQYDADQRPNIDEVIARLIWLGDYMIMSRYQFIKDLSDINCHMRRNHCYLGYSENGGKNYYPHGLGVMVEMNGGVKCGQWEYGKLNGHGVEYFADGSRHEGQQKDNRFDGFGIFDNNRGFRYEG